MGMQLLSFPSIIRTEASAPVITSSSVLWRDTDDDVLYFSDGTSWKQFSSASDSAGFESMLSEVVVEILRLSAEGTLTAPDYNSMFIDYMGAAAGQDGTIDTGNTTAAYSSDSYLNSSYSRGSVNLNGGNGGQSTSTSFFVSKTLDINPDAVIYDVGWTGYKTGGEVQTYAKFTYDDATTYTGATKTGASAHTQTNPYVSKIVTQIQIYSRLSSSSGYNTAAYSCIAYNVDETISDLLVQTNAQALSFSPAYIHIHSKDYETAGTGSLSYDVSFDGGSTWDSTDNEFNTKNSITDGSSKNMVIKFNLNGTGSGNTAEIKDYEVMLWSS